MLRCTITPRTFLVFPVRLDQVFHEDNGNMLYRANYSHYSSAPLLGQLV